MDMFAGKKGLIVGVANDHSIAWAIAEEIMKSGGECGFTHLPDRADKERKSNHRRVHLLTPRGHRYEVADVVRIDSFEGNRLE